jgi:hypothetical protein
MQQNYQKASFKKLIDKLQEDSWQLELLISGFAIFGLFYAIDPVNDALFDSVRGGETFFIRLLSAVKMFIFILIFNLIVHIILRGLWIGALGLRYVSGEIEYEELKYSKKFTKYLKRKVGSFDNYIGKLENYCSIIFAISFLLIFYVIALSIMIVIINFIGNNLLDNENLPKWIAKGFGIPIMIFIILGSVLTFFDLVTAGLLKKKQWVSKIYFPFYWIFSILTLSFLYRPLVYNFLDNKFGKRISLLLIPLFILIPTLSSLYYQKSNFFTENNDSNEIIANNANYEDLKKDNLSYLIHFTIQSKVITEPYLKIHIPYFKTLEDRIFKFNPSLKPEKDKRGLQTDIVLFSSNSRAEEKVKKIKQDSLRTEYVKTFNTIYNIKIDSTVYKTDFIVDKIKNEKFGLETYIGIKNLKEGKHLLKISRYLKKDSIGEKVVSKIPFWYFKN